MGAKGEEGGQRVEEESVRECQANTPEIFTANTGAWNDGRQPIKRPTLVADTTQLPPSPLSRELP